MQEMMNAIKSGENTVTIGDTDLSLLEAAKRCASECMDTMEGERLRRALYVCAAVADYAAFDKEPTR